MWSGESAFGCLRFHFNCLQWKRKVGVYRFSFLGSLTETSNAREHKGKMRKKRSLLAVGLGSTLEWYDFALYGFYSPIFAKLYFPPNDFQINLLQTFGLFTIGFLVRPIGGLIFGQIGDKFGRIKCLKLTPVLITLPTVAIALLPTYESIGLLAPLLLLISRIVQGLFIGGEYAGNMVYLCESVPKRRYLWGSLASCTGSFGIFLASLMSSVTYWLFSNAFLESYGWRIAFFFSIFLGIIAYFTRKNIPESIDFENLKTKQSISKNPLRDVIKFDWHLCIVGLSLLFLHATTFYAVFTFMPTKISENHSSVAGLALKYTSLFLFIRLFIIPLVGIIAEKVGGKVIMRVSSLLFIFLSYPLFNLIIQAEFPSDVIALGVFALLTTLNAGTVPGLLTEILPTRTRYTTFSFIINAGFGIFGGIAPMVLQFLINRTSTPVNASFYMVFCGIIALMGSFFLKKGAENG